MTSITPSHVPVSVITTCYGRNRHLTNLLTSLASGSALPAEVIIVNDDVSSNQLAAFDLNIVQLPTTLTQSDSDNDSDISSEANELFLKDSGFDIGRNRNIGARHATYESLIFLDVDCIVSFDFIQGLANKLKRHPDALLMGQPRYLTRPIDESEAHQLLDLQQAGSWLNELSVLNPYRYNMGSEVDMIATQDYGAFWSLCFAVTRARFEQIGGFDTHYVGYGAEDTDFAFMARALNIEFYLTCDVVYHQQHGVYRPPLNHLSSIIINANRFFDKWQHWPMGGWLASFAQMGLIDWEAGQHNLIIITRLPSESEIEAAHCPDAPYV
ncbi:MAG: glycosyltransferase [Psychrobacter sp.]|nr:glycosyltransferase [Psychrobacter sp.]